MAEKLGSTTAVKECGCGDRRLCLGFNERRPQNCDVLKGDHGKIPGKWGLVSE